jgi:sec-independent protein translocase protein TatC
MSQKEQNETSNRQDKFKEMTFWEHLGELRKRLIRIIMAWLVMSIVAFINRNIIFDKIILAPKDNDFISYRLLCQLGHFMHIDSLCMDTHIKLINYNLSGQFMTHMTISMVAGLILAMPYVFWQLWQFIKPALYENERRYARSAVYVMSALFILGILFSYYLIVPWTLNFLGTYQVSASVENQIALGSYISTVVSVILWMGVTFEFPVVIFVLAKLGIVTPEFLKVNRKYAFVIVLILAAIITPPDIPSQVIATIPLWALYEASILVAKSVAPGKNDIKDEEADAEEV